VWKLQDPGFDQGYGSERSPEDDYVPPIVPAVSLEAYEAELRSVYPFINDGKLIIHQTSQTFVPLVKVLNVSILVSVKLLLQLKLPCYV
jgi:hypothetical protein